MRILLTFVPLLFVSFSNKVLACSCAGNSYTFSLVDYDEASMVVEVSIIGLRQEPDSLLRSREAYPELAEKAKLNGEAPPPPPPPRQWFFTAQVQEVFKGSAEMKEIVLRTRKDGGACGWSPYGNGPYLMYLHQDKDREGSTEFMISLCSRVNYEGSSTYVQERAILSGLARAENGLLRGKHAFHKKFSYDLFSGTFLNGKREGVWLIHPPIFDKPDTLRQHKPVLALVYENGELRHCYPLGKFPKPEPYRRNTVNSWLFFYLQEQGP